MKLKIASQRIYILEVSLDPFYLRWFPDPRSSDPFNRLFCLKIYYPVIFNPNNEIHEDDIPF
jgi:hypothetical protein